jgi:hypothetical protein
LGYLVLLFGGMIVEPGGISLSTRVFSLSSPTMTAVQYVLLIAGLALLVWFWFHKRYEIQIMAPGVSLSGTPANYEDAERFSILLLSGVRTPPAASNKTEDAPETASSKSDPDWQL